MAFASPDDMCDDWYYQNSRQCRYEEKAENEMEEFKEDAIKRFHLISPNFAEAIAVTTAWAYENGIEDARKIVNYLFLNEKHIVALNNDVDGMISILHKEKDQRDQDDQEFEHLFEECRYGY